MVKEGKRVARQNTTEQHVVLISELGPACLGHATPISGAARDIQTIILVSLEKVDRSKLQAVGCDGTGVNTGSENGKIWRHLELSVGHPPQLFVCYMQMN
ncbi:hypothetical protein AVEN_238373-1 [Araneus ventricosus]|uniref:DUF4371 domain-containing protein n=1 Tax=Araneus ventricosus TaxID=182803 RepID=A0A4Y2K997_ARAVE|nr:hypothetical protein AVEN_238373-1 [Araneus ventricosus]